MYRIQNIEMAEMFDLPVGHICSAEEEAAIKPVWSKHLADTDNARFAVAVETANDHAYIVTDTWQRNGKRLRRGEVVYVKGNADAMGSVMVTRSKSKSAQGFVWTCSMDEVHRHAAKARDIREAAKTETKEEVVMKPGRKARRWYAEHCPYGLNTVSEGNTLMVFDTAEERDEMVKELNEADGNLLIVEGVARAITRKEAAETYRTQDLFTWYEQEVPHLRTCHGRCFFQVGSKRFGPLF